MNTTATKHKRYDETFKRTAVEHWLLSGQSATRIAEELGVEARVWNDNGEKRPGKTASSWVVLARDNKTLGSLYSPVGDLVDKYAGGAQMRYVLMAAYGFYVNLVIREGRLARLAAARIEHEIEEEPRLRLPPLVRLLMGLALVYLGVAVAVVWILRRLAARPLEAVG